jgi:hypothetical protein
MLEFFRKLFTPDFMPDGYCMRWNSDELRMVLQYSSTNLRRYAAQHQYLARHQATGCGA